MCFHVPFYFGPQGTGHGWRLGKGWAWVPWPGAGAAAGAGAGARALVPCGAGGFSLLLTQDT